jgi:hypothetical protein
VKPKIVIIGITFALLAIPAYIMIPHFITKAMNKLPFGNEQSPIANQIFSQLGMPPIPSTPEIIAFVQYCCIGLVVAGIGIIIFGLVSKKTRKLFPVKVSLEPDQKLQDENPNSKAIHLLQEKLAKGEITSSQYQNLRKLLEEKR